MRAVIRQYELPMQAGPFTLRLARNSNDGGASAFGNSGNKFRGGFEVLTVLPVQPTPMLIVREDADETYNVDVRFVLAEVFDEVDGEDMTGDDYLGIFEVAVKTFFLFGPRK